MEQEMYALKDIYAKMYESFIKKDRKLYDEIFTNSFCLKHFTGITQTKEELWKDIADGQLNYFAADTESIDVTVVNNSAKVVGRTKCSAAVYGGAEASYNLQQSLQAIKENDKWMFTESSTSTY